MQNVTPDQAAEAIIQFFIKSLLRIERDRIDLDVGDASMDAGCSYSECKRLESGAQIIEPSHWKKATEVLELSSNDVVRRLNAFISKHMNIWMERDSTTKFRICEKAVTSPKALRSGNTIMMDLSKLRPNLFYVLSSFSPVPEEIMDAASNLGFLAPSKSELPARDSVEEPGDSSSDKLEDQKQKILDAIEKMSPEKVGLIERFVDKFERFSPKDLALAYKHFKLSLSNVEK
jgi:hypothetical protein